MATRNASGAAGAVQIPAELARFIRAAALYTLSSAAEELQCACQQFVWPESATDDEVVAVREARAKIHAAEALIDELGDDPTIAEPLSLTLDDDLAPAFAKALPSAIEIAYDDIEAFDINGHGSLRRQAVARLEALLALHEDVAGHLPARV
jgi:hypothetical protein